MNFEHINFLKVGITLGQPAGYPEGKVFISRVSRRTHKLFGLVNPGTTNRLSQGHLVVNQSEKFMFMCLFFLPEWYLQHSVCKMGLSMLLEDLDSHCARTPYFHYGCGFFAYSWKLPVYSGAFLLTIDNCSFVAYNWSFFAYNFNFFTYSWSFFAYNGKVRLIRALRGV